MPDFLERTERIIGEETTRSLSGMHVAVFGVGGVGGYVCEAIARCGVGKITIIDKDVVDITNINRQIIALHSTIGMSKCEVMKNRIKDINPEAEVIEHSMLFMPENADEIDFSQFDYVADCVDTVTAKLCIIERCKAANVPVISSMGTGNKLDPSKFEITDIQKTSVCPLAKVMRHECKVRGIEHVKVLFSTELPVKTNTRAPGSISFVPSTAGLIIAGEIIRDLMKYQR